MIEIISTSMASNYKGIIFDNLKNQKNISYQSRRLAEQEKAGEEFLRGN